MIQYIYSTYLRIRNLHKKTFFEAALRLGKFIVCKIIISFLGIYIKIAYDVIWLNLSTEGSLNL